MSHQVFQAAQEFEPLAGLGGPFRYRNGRVAYYDPKEGAYYDPTTDFYLTAEETIELHGI